MICEHEAALQVIANAWFAFPGKEFDEAGFRQQFFGKFWDGISSGTGYWKLESTCPYDWPDICFHCGKVWSSNGCNYRFHCRDCPSGLITSLIPIWHAVEFSGSIFRFLCENKVNISDSYISWAKVNAVLLVREKQNDNRIEWI